MPFETCLDVFAVVSPCWKLYSPEGDRTFEGDFDGRLFHAVLAVERGVAGGRGYATEVPLHCRARDRVRERGRERAGERWRGRERDRGRETERGRGREGERWRGREGREREIERRRGIESGRGSEKETER